MMTPIHSFTLFVLLLVSVSYAIPFATQAPEIHPSGPASGSSLHCRASDPEFPANIPSCPICQQNWSGINNCASAAPVFANFSMVRVNELQKKRQQMF